MVRCEKCGKRILEEPVIKIIVCELRTKKIKWLGKSIRVEEKVLTFPLCHSCLTKLKIWLEIEEKKIY